jgi:hypothetical protein
MELDRGTSSQLDVPVDNGSKARWVRVCWATSVSVTYRPRSYCADDDLR